MPPHSTALKTILLSGLLAGTCDITAALIVYCSISPVTPIRLLQGISAGILGRQSAYAGGPATAALGLLCHYVIALGAAATYFALSSNLPFLNPQRNPLRRPLGHHRLFRDAVRSPPALPHRHPPLQPQIHNHRLSHPLLLHRPPHSPDHPPPLHPLIQRHPDQAPPSHRGLWVPHPCDFSRVRV